jgi:hypothetical protein
MRRNPVEVLLNVVSDLAVLGSIALLVWGMVLCSMLALGEGRHARVAGEHFRPFENPAHEIACANDGAEPS